MRNKIIRFLSNPPIEGGLTEKQIVNKCGESAKPVLRELIKEGRVEQVGDYHWFRR